MARKWDPRLGTAQRLTAALALIGVWASPSQAQTLRGLTAVTAQSSESATICGQAIPEPQVLPPITGGPIVYMLGPCFDGRGRPKSGTAVAWLDDIQLRPSRPTEGIWVPFDGNAERVILEDFQRLWRNHGLDNLNVDIRDYRFSNGVVGKLVVYNIKEHN
jgi:hypothetical protein